MKRAFRWFLALGILHCLCAPANAAEPRLKNTIVVQKMWPIVSAFSPDGKLMVVSGMTGQVSVESGPRLKITNIKRVIALVDAHSGKVKKQLMKEGPVKNDSGNDPIAFSADGKRIFTLGDAIDVWDADEGKQIATWGEKLEKAVFSADRRFALARHQYPNQTYEAFDLADGRSLGVFDTKEYGQLAPVSADAMFLVGLKDKRITLLNLKTGDRTVLSEPEEGIYFEVAVAASPDGKVLAVANKAGNIRLWDLAGKKPLAESVDAKAVVHELHFSPDGALLAWVSKSKVNVWSRKDGSLLSFDSGYSSGVADLCFSDDSRSLATTGHLPGADLKVWEISGP